MALGQQHLRVLPEDTTHPIGIFDVSGGQTLESFFGPAGKAGYDGFYCR